MSLTVKAYLKNDENSNPEIRRFAVPLDVPDYQLLERRVCEIFPSLHHGFFSLHWRDAEGDDIILSSDQEMAEAISSVSDGVLKIYVTVIPRPASPGELHQGVSCSSCRRAIYGARYKCCVCPDYNLCRQCEIQDAHPDHDMWKITTPSEMWTPEYGEHFIPHHVLEYIRQNERESKGHKPNCCSSSAGSGPNGAWASATSSSDGTSATSKSKLTWADVGQAWAGYGHSWNEAAKKFSHSLAKTMDIFGDLQIDGDYGDDDVTNVKKHEKVNDAREMEFEQNMFGDGDGKPAAQTGRHESDVGTNGYMRVGSGLPGPIHPDPKIAKALIQMLSMGFSNEEGTLIRLLEEKDGDIDQVIGILDQNEEKTIEFD